MTVKSGTGTHGNMGLVFRGSKPGLTSVCGSLRLHLQHVELYSTEYIPGKTDQKLLEGMEEDFQRGNKGHQSKLADHAASQSS